MQLVYMGFTQEASLRCFHFQRVLAQSNLANLPRVVQFTLKADMSLFMQYRIPVQEGPAICLQILTNELEAADVNAAANIEPAQAQTSYAVTTEHLTSFVSARTISEEARLARRKPRPPFKPSNSSQLKLPPRIN
jgi:hypothetical protein